MSQLVDNPSGSRQVADPEQSKHFPNGVGVGKSGLRLSPTGPVPTDLSWRSRNLDMYAYASPNG
jgi:hypothetical protein